MIAKLAGISMLVIGILIMTMAGIFLMAAIGMEGDSEECQTSSADTDEKVDGVPSKFIPFYVDAAEQFDLGNDGPEMLAGMHYSETNFSTNIATSGPYVGPMAIGSDFWDTYGQDGDGDGKKDIMNEADAIFAASKILKQYDAPRDWRNALASYNAGPGNKSAGYPYAEKVMDFAKEHELSGSAGSSSGAEECEDTDTGGSVSGNVQQLARQLLQNKNVSYPLDAVSPNGSTKKVLEDLADGKKAPVTCPEENSGPVNVDVGMMKFLVEYAKEGKVGINSITDKCHTEGSNHYAGTAVDFECRAVPFSTSKADSIAKKNGGGRNSETCAANLHWHYDF